MSREITFSDWPKAGDSLHGAGPWKAEALVGVFEVDWEYDYASAYKEAADELVRGVLDQRLAPDSAVYPILFLYRHYIELILKGIVAIGAKLEKATVSYEKIHAINDLWRKARARLEQAFPEAEKTDTDIVEQCIREFATWDASGEASRYARRKNGASTWNGTKQLNLANMRDVMSRMAGLLDGSYEGMCEQLQCQADMDADLSSESSE